MGKVLIIGGAGLLGSHLVPAFEKAGHEVFINDNFSGSLIHRSKSGPSVYTADATKYTAMAYVFEKVKPDIVILATGYHYAKDTRYNAFDEGSDILNAANVLCSLLNQNIKKVYYCSHSDIYGGPESKSLSEDRKVVLPSTYRGASYLAAEKIIELRCKELGADLAILRLFDVIGPRVMASPITCRVNFLIDSFIKREQIGIVGADKKRDLLHVSDAVSAIIGLHEVGFSGVVNIGSGAGIQLRRIVKELHKSIKVYYPPIETPDKKLSSFSAVADVSRLKEVVHWWEPKVGVFEYLPDLVEFRRKEALYYSAANRPNVLQDQRRGGQ